MKKVAILLVTASISIITANIALAQADTGIADRIKKVGTVCVEGSDCVQSAAVTAVASAGSGASGGSAAEANYKKTCATCHAIGVAGAPKLGDTTSWEPRIAKGMGTLYQSAINGMPPGMPAKGMCFTCSDDELKALVDYMVDTAR